MLSINDIERMFSHHPPANEEVANTHQLIRDIAKSTAIAFQALTPASPERTLAIRKIQEAMMYANSAVAQYSPRREVAP